MLSKDRPIRDEELKLNASPELNKENIQKYNFDKTRPIRDEELKMYYPEQFSRKRMPIRDDELEPVPLEDNRENKQNRSVPKKRRQHSPTHMMIKNATKPKILVYYEILKSNNPNNEKPLNEEKFGTYLRKISKSEDDKKYIYIYVIPINNPAPNIPVINREMLKEFENEKIIHKESPKNPVQNLNNVVAEKKISDSEYDKFIRDIKNLNLKKNDEDELIDELNNLNVAKGIKRKYTKHRKYTNHRKYTKCTKHTNHRKYTKKNYGFRKIKKVSNMLIDIIN